MTIKCSTCGHPLNVVILDELTNGKQEYYIKPCPHCSKSEYNRGYADACGEIKKDEK